MKCMQLARPARLVCMADTHGLHRQVNVPEGEFLVHAGDFLRTGTDPAEIEDFDDWLAGLPHRHKIVVAGNHDLLFERDPKLARKRLPHALYLENAAVAVGGLRFWGSPVTPVLGEWAFRAERVKNPRALWAKIPARVDVLLTHGPPFGTLDRQHILGQHFGCRELTRAVLRARPRLHVFGHVHGGWGQEQTGENGDGTRFVNCALLADGLGLRRPTVVELA